MTVIPLTTARSAEQVDNDLEIHNRLWTRSANGDQEN
jgi:hypothetical protein